MNIFVLSRNPKLAARYHCDKHVVKMILESVQMLSTTNAFLGYDHPYRVTHINHPCTVWVRQSKANYMWLLDLTYWLEEERLYRFNSTKTHKSIDVLDRMQIPRLPNIGLTKFAQAMPLKFRQYNAVAAYRAYYHSKTFATWKHREVPYWFSGEVDENKS